MHFSRTQKKIVFVVNDAAFFVSHRLPLAEAAQKKGWKVTLLTGRPASRIMHAETDVLLKQKNILHKMTLFRSSGINPLLEVLGLIQLFFMMRRERPDIVHTVTPKGNLYGGLIARLLRVERLVVAVSGMGYLFTRTASGAKRLLRYIYLKGFSWIFQHPNMTAIVQNTDDKKMLLGQKWILPHQMKLIPGSGVPLRKYLEISEEQETDTVILPARIIRDKGVIEFVEAARVLKARGCDWKFLLIGTADHDNLTAIPIEQIQGWVSEGVVEWAGYQKDMIEFFAKSSIVCLPSYREGMPKCLLEAAAAGRAVVTTDAIGCREAIIPSKTGELVQIGNVASLTRALEKLINNPGLRRKYGRAGRELAIGKYDVEKVIMKTIEIYDKY